MRLYVENGKSHFLGMLTFGIEHKNNNSGTKTLHCALLIVLLMTKEEEGEVLSLIGRSYTFNHIVNIKVIQCNVTV